MEEYLKEIAGNPYVQIAAILASVLAFLPLFYRWLRAILKFIRAGLVDGPRNVNRRMSDLIDQRVKRDVTDVRLVVVTLFIYVSRVALNSFFIVVFSFLAVLTKSVDPIGLNSESQRIVQIGTIVYWIAVYLSTGQVFLNLLWASQYCNKIRKNLSTENEDNA